MNENNKTDKISYAPFILVDTGSHTSLILSDSDMLAKSHIFEEREAEGWMGNGYDWNSLAQVVVAEQLPEFADELSFDPEAGMFSAIGDRLSLEKLGTKMCAMFHSDEAIRDILSRAELD
jgi:Immunity protein 51